MRLPHALAALLAIALTFGAMPVEACHGDIQTITLACGSNPLCPVVYIVTSNAGPGMILAIYEESNGVAGLQRGAAALVPGGFDHCVVAGAKDTRIV